MSTITIPDWFLLFMVVYLAIDIPLTCIKIYLNRKILKHQKQIRDIDEEFENLKEI